MQFMDVARIDAMLPPRPTTLPLMAGQLRARSIVDYGGGSGWAFESIKKSCPGLGLKNYIVLELPDVVEAYAVLPPKDSRLSYKSFHDIGSMTSADLLYANASLHYAESDEVFLDTAISLGPAPTILMDGYLAHPALEFFLVQSVYGHEVPVRIPRITSALKVIEERGYQVSACTPMLGPVSGEYRYDLPLEHLGAPWSGARRYCILAQYEGKR
jgi:putative methyltransferase (TIGR04325 family)